MIKRAIIFLALLQASSLKCSQKDSTHPSAKKHYERDKTPYSKAEKSLLFVKRKIADKRPEKSTVAEIEKEHKSNSSIPAFIYDKYTQRRGAPKMLEISCNSCDAYLMSYQKDGPGSLLRCYLDRIHYPKELSWRQYDRFSARYSPKLTCAMCEYVIGTPMIYHSENRPAYRMIPKRFAIAPN